MENTTYRVNVTSPGLTVLFRNRVNRTPVLFETVYKSEIDILELQLRQKSRAYKISKNVAVPDLHEMPSDEVIEENEEVKVEELYSKEETDPESILDKLIAEDNWMEKPWRRL